MPIVRIIICELFNKYTYEVSLNDKITIVVGANGSGKTSVFRLINALRAGNTSLLCEIPFRCLILEFENGSILQIEKTKNFDGMNLKNVRLLIGMKAIDDVLLYSFASPNPDCQMKYHWIYSPQSNSININSLGIQLFRIQDEDQEKYGRWVYESKEETIVEIGQIEIDNIMNGLKECELHPPQTGQEHFQEIIPIDEYRKELIDVASNCLLNPRWFDDIRKSISFEMIGTGRAAAPGQPMDAAYKYAKWRMDIIQQRFMKTRAMFIVDLEQMREIIPKVIGYEARLSRILGNAFVSYCVDAIESRINIADLIAFGEWFSRSYNIDIRIITDLSGIHDDETTLENWNVHYCEIVETFCKILEDMHIHDYPVNRDFRMDVERIETFIGLLSDKVEEKFLRPIGNRNLAREPFPLHFDASRNLDISMEKASSGEQNLYIMYFRLIFDCVNSMIAIDEPELSLHIDWQSKFVHDILEIIKVTSNRVIILTHSPDIIGNYWEDVILFDGSNGVRRCQASQ